MPDMLVYLLVPLLTGLIGWSTNWVGVRIMLYPARFVGVGFIGWQGIIPRLRVRLTRGLVQHSISEVCTPADMLQAVDDADAIYEISQLIYPDMEDWLDELLSRQYGAYWNLAPTLVRNRVFAMMRSQAVAWYLYPNSLVLPLFGLMVGAFTNWLALKILMHPSRPVRFMGMSFQGLFIARQQEVAVDFTRIFTENFLTIRQVIQFVWNGERKDE
ncbi:Uncharacterized protein SCF082_LOCUS21297, partial [Durusdinium trenchii]